MSIDPKLVEQWWHEWYIDPRDDRDVCKYIAQRAADYALEQAAQHCDDECTAANGQDLNPNRLADEIRALKATK